MTEKTLNRIGLTCDLYSICLVLFAFTFLFHRHAQFSIIDWPQLFGHKTEAMFDLWFFHHLTSGCVIGWVVTTFIAGKGWMMPRNLLMFCLSVAVAALSWESIEFMTELNGYEHGLFQWMNGPEHWTNRFIADPGAIFIGAFLARHRPKITIPALAYTIIWIVINGQQETCMSIQERLFNTTPQHFFFLG